MPKANSEFLFNYSLITIEIKFDIKHLIFNNKR